VLGEEFGERKGASNYRWVLDPVDGTRAFITGRHEWGSLIALEQDGVPVLGILTNRYWASGSLHEWRVASDPGRPRIGP